MSPNHFIDLIHREFGDGNINIVRIMRIDEFRLGGWFIDLGLGERVFLIEFRPLSGFGLSIMTEDMGYGIGHDEAYQDAETLIVRIRDLHFTGCNTREN